MRYEIKTTPNGKPILILHCSTVHEAATKACGYPVVIEQWASETLLMLRKDGKGNKRLARAPLRPVAVGRKFHLYAGTDKCGVMYVSPFP